MSIWVWVPIGGVAVIAVPIVVSLAVARILGGIAGDVSRALDLELWTSAPLMREMEQAADELFAWHAPGSVSASDR